MTISTTTPKRAALRKLLNATLKGCTNCGNCIHECAFLQRYGSPKMIAERFDAASKDCLAQPFACSLCGLCSAICPEQLDLAGMFLEMRREAVDREQGLFPEHGSLRRYEQIGRSRWFTLYRVPHGCTTIFFPGCALSGSRPDGVTQVFATLQQIDPNMGIVLDCCLSPSHSLGQEEYVKTEFEKLRTDLVDHGVTEVLVACPNCKVMFDTLGDGLRARTVWEKLAESDLELETTSGIVTIHDPCVLRESRSVHQAVRDLLKRQGVTIEEMPHSTRKTICCGQGSGVKQLDPKLAKSWIAIRKKEAAGRRMITYCSGCAQALARHTPTSHLVDMLFAPRQTVTGKKKGSGSLFAYLNRLFLKRALTRMENSGRMQERTQRPTARKKKRLLPLFLLGTILLSAGTSFAANLGLIESAELRQQSAQWVILDARPLSAWQMNHIPGALSFSWENYTRTDEKGVPHKMLPPKDLANALGALGISEATPVAIYGDANTSWGGEGWVVWALSLLGHKGPIRLLAGGIQSWSNQGLPLATAAEKARAIVTYRYNPQPQLDISTEELKRDLSQFVLIDTRSTFEWLQGRLPNAIHIPWKDFYSGKERRPLTSNELRKLLEKKGVNLSRPIVYYCTGGVRSAYAWTVHELSGLPSARNYEGGMEEWSRAAKN